MTAGRRLLELHADPAFAAARDERGRERFLKRREEMQRRSNARRRGVDVPPHLEDQWRVLKRKRMTNAEAAKALGLKYRKPRR
jgi:hypothetical protein